MQKTLKIVKYPAAILKKKAKELTELTPDVLELIPEMERTMDTHQGIGLAAPQVGVSKQIILLKEEEGSSVFFNPVLLELSKETETEEEGCLSLPGLFVPVKRAQKVRVACSTKEGKSVVLEAEGLAARVFQHEIDHLQGILIIERISALRRLRIKKQLQEIETKGAVQEHKHKP